MQVYDDISLSIGNTPLVRLKKLTKANILLKIESRNPANSVKCRIGANMIWQAEKDGFLKSGMEIVEPTSGNTGIALAFVGAARGYQVTLTMPETMSIERRKVMKALGANIVLTEGAKGMRGAVEKAQELLEASPDTRFMPQQFNNPANPAIHEQTTGPEIWNDTDGTIDVLVAGVGTGGTISGISRYIKNTQGKAITSIAVEPEASPIISQALKGESISPAPHKIQGIGANFIPENLDLSVVDQTQAISNELAIETAQKLMKEEGILAGISGGAAVAAALRISEQAEFKDKTIVVILPDSGERYLSTILFDGLFSANEGA
ncbi:cysteine synthase A [Oceaniserpentilla sp. 4NH20-0058]|uniref:cysteine synthase A n=1 Tax=Oceaniserpentilla sp. 4NH20-0058 TaxID=3127660 RepID=UPI003103CBA3